MTSLPAPGHWLAIDWILLAAIAWVALGAVGVLAHAANKNAVAAKVRTRIMGSFLWNPSPPV